MNKEIRDSNLTIKVTKKPPQSPVMNVLELVYFTSIQVLQHKKVYEYVKDLDNTVKYSFEELEKSKLTDI